MATIIQFNDWKTRSGVAEQHVNETLPAGWAAEIIIFPGVRIDRDFAISKRSEAENRASH